MPVAVARERSLPTFVIKRCSVALSGHTPLPCDLLSACCASPHAGPSAVNALHLFTSPTFLHPTIIPDTSMHVTSSPESQSRLHFHLDDYRFIHSRTSTSTVSSHLSFCCIACTASWDHVLVLPLWVSASSSWGVTMGARPRNNLGFSHQPSRLVKRCWSVSILNYPALTKEQDAHLCTHEFFRNILFTFLAFLVVRTNVR